MYKRRGEILSLGHCNLQDSIYQVSIYIDTCIYIFVLYLHICVSLCSIFCQCSNLVPTKLSFTKFFKAMGVVSCHSCYPSTKLSYGTQASTHSECGMFSHFQSNVPLAYWTDCVLTIVYLINRTPSRLLSNKTPFELLWNKKTSLSHIRSFGCLCYSLKNFCLTFSPLAIRAVFLGYPLGYKGYKVLDLSTNVVFISRDVIFS